MMPVAIANIARDSTGRLKVISESLLSYFSKAGQFYCFDRIFDTPRSTNRAELTHIQSVDTLYMLTSLTGFGQVFLFLEYCHQRLFVG